MSRKTIMYVIGIITAIGTFIQQQMGLGISFAAVGASALAIVTYLQFQAKLDLKAIQQFGKFKDPKFYVGLIAAVLPTIGQIFGLELPVEQISLVLTTILTVLFGLVFKKASPA